MFENGAAAVVRTPDPDRHESGLESAVQVSRHHAKSLHEPPFRRYAKLFPVISFVDTVRLAISYGRQIAHIGESRKD